MTNQDYFPTCWKKKFGPFSVHVSAQNKDLSIVQMAGAGHGGHSRLKPRVAAKQLLRIACWLETVAMFKTTKGVPLRG